MIRTAGWGVRHHVWKVTRQASIPIIFVVTGLIVMLAGTEVNSQSAKETPASSDSGNKSRLARGEYLVTILGCNDCHTPMAMGPQGPEPDMSRMLSGHPEELKLPPPPPLAGPWLWAGAGTNTAFAGPWGISYAANLTPDQETGLGVWSEDTFVKALRSGKHMGGSRPIMPPMPWNWYAKMTDDDLKSVFAYLRSIPPMKNHVPVYQPPAAPNKP
jgi:mono/diheme cytochrome c family protein